MKLSKKWTTVTPLSKAIALAMFILLPVLGTFIGYKFGESSFEGSRIVYRNIVKISPVDCESEEVKQCIEQEKK